MTSSSSPSAAYASASDSAVARCDSLQSSCHRTARPARSSSSSSSSSGMSQTVSAAGISARSASVSGRPSSTVNANRPPTGSARATSSSSASLSRNASMRLEQEDHVEGAGRKRRDLGDLEATRQAARALAGEFHRRRAGVYAEVVAAELARQKAARSGDPATQVENRDARADCRPAPRASGSRTR